MPTLVNMVREFTVHGVGGFETHRKWLWMVYHRLWLRAGVPAPTMRG